MEKRESMAVKELIELDRDLTEAMVRAYDKHGFSVGKISRVTDIQEPVIRKILGK